jgi:hypothetical protein
MEMNPVTRIKVTGYSPVAWRKTAPLPVVTSVYFTWKSLLLSVDKRAFWEEV